MIGILFLLCAFIGTCAHALLLRFTLSIQESKLTRLLTPIIRILPELVFLSTLLFLKEPKFMVAGMVSANVIGYFMVAILDLFFIRFCRLKDVHHNHIYMLSLLTYIMVVMNLSFFQYRTTLSLGIGLPSIIILLIYFMYLLFQPSKKEKVQHLNIHISLSGFIVLTIISIVTFFFCTKYGLTLFPSLNLFTIFLFGMMISLSKGVLYYYLFKEDGEVIDTMLDISMAHFYLLALADMLHQKTPIYFFGNQVLADFCKFSLYLTMLLFFYLMRGKKSNLITYAIPPILIVLGFFFLWV